MASRAATIGDALVTWLNDVARSWPSPWSGSVAAVRTYEVAETLENLDNVTLVQLVVPEDDDGEEAETRGRERQDYRYYLGVRERYGSTGSIANSWVDARIELVDAIASALPRIELTGQPTGFEVRCESARILVRWDAEALRDQRTYVGVIEIVMRERRPRTP